jgi:hypothetical protein
LETTGGDLNVGGQALLVFHVAQAEETLTQHGLQINRRKNNEPHKQSVLRS